MVNELRVGGHAIGYGHPCFVIAEAGVNHNGDVGLAKELIDESASAGADAVKFQTFKTAKLVTRGATIAEYQKSVELADETQFGLLKRLELSADAHRELVTHCQRRNVLFLSTPFEEESVDLLAELGVLAYKVGSGELTDLPLLSHIARKSKPMVLSTGMATMVEVDAAVRVVRESGDPPLALLHCVSNYPAAAEDVNLRAMQTLRSAFGVPVGYSDHTAGIEIACAAVALGACIVEKHVTLDRSMSGPDHRASVEPNDLRALVAAVRRIEAALGDGRKKPAVAEMAVSQAVRKSLVAACDISVGTLVTDDMIVLRRPGTGLLPTARPTVVGRRSIVSIPEGAVITTDMFA